MSGPSSQFSPAQVFTVFDYLNLPHSDLQLVDSSMSTPIKLRTVNLSDHRTDPMKAALKFDLAGHTFQEIGVVDFVTTVWVSKRM